MDTLAIASTSPYAGKSLVAIGLGRVLRSLDRDVGYVKPYGEAPVVVEGETYDQDAVTMREALELETDLSALSPVVLTHDLRVRLLRGESFDAAERVDRAIDEASSGRDVLLVGGGRTLHAGGLAGLSNLALLKTRRWPVLLVEAYDIDENELCIDCVLAARQALGDRLVGVCLNKVRTEALETVEELVVPYLEGRDVPVLATIPHDPAVESIPARALCAELGGSFLGGEDHADRAIRGFQIGAMEAQAALSIFRRGREQAVITGGDRSDIQAAALEAGVAALVLTGGHRPGEALLRRAERAGVPVLSVPGDTYSVVDQLDEILGRFRLKGPEKIARAESLVRDRLDVDRLLELL